MQVAHLRASPLVVDRVDHGLAAARPSSVMSFLLGGMAAATLPHVAALTTLLDVPIRFDVGDMVTHAPMVDVVVNGTPTRLILDTGSTDHVLTIELARAAGLPHEPGEAGTDHAGESVDSWFVGDVALEIDGVAFALHDAVAITGPAPFEGWGVGGFLSPQHVHPTAQAVIDLADDRLSSLNGDDAAVEAWLRARSPERDADRTRARSRRGDAGGRRLDRAVRARGDDAQHRRPRDGVRGRGRPGPHRRVAARRARASGAARSSRRPSRTARYASAMSGSRSRAC